MPRGDKVLVALDIGTRFVRALVAQIDGDDIIFLGKGDADTNGGISGGNVVDLDRTTTAIRKAISEAEKMANYDVRTVTIGLSNENMSFLNSQGIVTIRGKEIVQTDIDRVMEQAQSIGVGSDRRIVGVEIQEFIVDGQQGIQNPRGMSAQRLEVRVHIVMAQESSIQNLLRAIGNADLSVDGIVVNAIADSYAVLEDDERDLGVALIDIGHGTTDITLVQNGSPFFTKVVSVGGDWITRDLCAMFHISPKDAEQIKIAKGSALASWVNPDDEVTMTLIGSRDQIVKSVSDVAHVIQSRVEELLEIIQQHIVEASKGRGDISIAVLTGGTANLRNINDLFKDKLTYKQSRVGHPSVKDDGHGLAEVLKRPEYATVVGIVKYSVERKKKPSVKKRGKFTEFIKRLFE